MSTNGTGFHIRLIDPLGPVERNVQHAVCHGRGEHSRPGVLLMAEVAARDRKLPADPGSMLE